MTETVDGLEELPYGVDPVALAAQGAASGVQMDFRPWTPRYQVVADPDPSWTRWLWLGTPYCVYVFTNGYVWDHIAGHRATKWAAHRLGRKAVREALKRTPEEGARRLRWKDQPTSSPLPLGVVERAALRERLRPVMHTQLSLRCGGVLLTASGAVGFAEQHAGETGGCPDDGTGCLCECHDR